MGSPSRISLLLLLAVAATPMTAYAGGPYGPDTCRQGYVCREAFPGDHVCIEPSVRDEAARDNRRASARREPGGGAYGPNTCRQGYVWREARRGDLVCVTPETRDQAAADNRRAVSRRTSGGGHVID